MRWHAIQKDVRNVVRFLPAEKTCFLKKPQLMWEYKPSIQQKILLRNHIIYIPYYFISHPFYMIWMMNFWIKFITIETTRKVTTTSANAKSATRCTKHFFNNVNVFAYNKECQLVKRDDDQIKWTEWILPKPKLANSLI